MGFSTFGLSDHVIQGVRAAGYTIPTPIQSLAIKPALEGKDVIGSAQTGTGKTAAFVLPMLHRLASSPVPAKRDHAPGALVITPTRELAQQVHDAIITYGKFMTLKTVVIYGGVSMDNQLKLLRRGVDIVIATPGRLLDHMQRRSIDLSKIRILVLDEADRMLDMGFINDVKKIIAAVPKERQTMLFSATISGEIKNLASDILRDPQLVEVGERQSPAETITQHFYGTHQQTKMDLLVHALETEKMESVLVFSRTKHGADKICRRLEHKGVKAIAIHSNRTQSQRQRALDGFKMGQYRVLVATDIAARGIDVDGISHVINYDIPQYAEDYIHRIGRTGRAGATGDAITFVSPDDRQYLRSIEKFTGKQAPVETYQGFVPSPEALATKPHAPSTGRPHVSHNQGHHMNEHRAPVTRGQAVPASHNPHKKRDERKFPAQRRKKPFEFGRKKKPGRKMEAFSSDMGGAGWSNY